MLYFLPPHAKQDFFLHLLAGCASSLPLDAMHPEMLPEPLAWQALHKAAHLKGAGHWPGTAAPTQLRFSDLARSCQQNPAPQTPFPSPSSFPCASCWSCPPTRNWGTNTSPVCLKAQLFPSLTQRVCGCQRGSGPTSLHIECGRTKLCRHH